MPVPKGAVHAATVTPRRTFVAQGALVYRRAVHWLVVGCGYTGSRLVTALQAAGERVTATRRSAHAHPGVTMIALDLARPQGLPQDADVLVILAPPGPAPADEMRALVAMVGTPRTIYVSSTGVYGPAGGAWVDESWAPAPATASGVARVAAERALIDALPAGQLVILRPAGIYGPGRGIAERIRAGTYRIVGDGHAHISRIHVDDLVSAILAAGRASIGGVFNCADDAPDPIGEVADAIADAIGVPRPPRVDPASVSPEVAGMLLANRRIANTRLREVLGVTLAHPTWRDELAALRRTET